MSLPAHKPLDDSRMAYSNKTMVNNWWEDRYLPGDQKLSTTDRVFALDLESSPLPSSNMATTKRSTDFQMLTSPPPAVIKKPSMYSSSNIEAKIAQYGNPSKLTYTVGSVGPDSNRAPDYTFETTTQHFFADKPVEATTSRPGYYTNNKDHAVQGQLRKDTYDTTRREEEPRGRRGELSRNPKESGNPYGVSVFVDEYAQWQTKLAGMPLQDTVKKAQTKYF